MPAKKQDAEEYPVNILDLRDDFKKNATFEVMMDEENKCFRYWTFMNCVKWHIEIRPNSFECFPAYFKPPATWSAEVEIEVRANFTNSVKTNIYTARFNGDNPVNFRKMRLYKKMMTENMTSLKIEISLSVIKMTNFGMVYDYFDSLPQRENVLLRVEDRLIKVNRQYLALMSPFFKALFYGELSANQEVYELKWEKFTEVATFLRCVYPHRHSVSKKSLDYLLELADRWECQPIIDACEMFICAHYHEYQKKTEKCFSYVERYKMQRLLRIMDSTTKNQKTRRRKEFKNRLSKLNNGAERQ